MKRLSITSTDGIPLATLAKPYVWTLCVYIYIYIYVSTIFRDCIACSFFDVQGVSSHVRRLGKRWEEYLGSNDRYLGRHEPPLSTCFELPVDR